MKIALFDDWRLGRVEGDTLVDLTDALEWSTDHPQQSLPRVLADPRALDAVEGPERALADVRLRPPLPRPPKVVGAPVNYPLHQEEMALATTIWDHGMFLKSPSSVIGPSDEIVLPFADRSTHHEGELGVIIGRPAYRIQPEDALDVVAAYTCLLDITVRGDEERSWRKSMRTFTPIGPWLVTADEIPDPGALTLRCRVNGETRQDAATADMFCDVETLVAYTSWAYPLEPGDLIATGTPDGVGPITPGDRVEVEISGIGTLAVSVSRQTGPAFADWEYHPARRAASCARS